MFELGINTTELIRDIRDTFLAESPALDNESLSGRSGTPISEAEFERAVMSADAALRSSVERFIAARSQEPYIDNSRQIPDVILYTFCGGRRRLVGKEQIIATTVHDSLKEASLGYLLGAVSVELAKKHSDAAAASLEHLSSILYSKKTPIGSV